MMRVLPLPAELSLDPALAPVSYGRRDSLCALISKP